MNAPHKNTATPPEPKFEAALDELEKLVQKMESGEMGLDDMVDAFERGQELVRQCTTRLNEVEKRIELLIRGEDGQPTTVPLDPP